MNPYTDYNDRKNFDAGVMHGMEHELCASQYLPTMSIKLGTNTGGMKPVSKNPFNLGWAWGISLAAEIRSDGFDRTYAMSRPDLTT